MFFESSSPGTKLLYVTVSNLAFILPMVKAIRLRYFDTATCLFLLLVTSSIYHACDNSRNYGEVKQAIIAKQREETTKYLNDHPNLTSVERNKIYYEAYVVDESEFMYYCLYRHSLLMFMDFYMASLAIIYCCLTFSRIEGQLKSSIMLVVSWIMIVVVLINKKGAGMWIFAGIFGGLFALIPKISRLERSKIHWPHVINGTVMLVLDGLIKGVIQTEKNYDFTHGVEHCLWAMCFYYFLRLREVSCDDRRGKFHACLDYSKIL